MADSPKCAIDGCGRSSSEHGPGRTGHVFTTEPGDLKTYDQVAKKERSANSGEVVTPVASRLIHILFQRGVIGLTDVEFILTGKHLAVPPDQEER